jgi:hypothetical protein
VSADPEVDPSIAAVSMYLSEAAALDAVGLFLAEAVQLMNVLEAACVHEAPEYAPLAARDSHVRRGVPDGARGDGDGAAAVPAARRS